eukprot:80919-Amphidinium_carterae.1
MVAFKDLKTEKACNYVTKLSEIVFPLTFKDDETFSAQAPRLCATDLADDQKAGILEAGIVEVLISLIHRQEQGIELLQDVAVFLRDSLLQEPP